ncbi:MAG: biotin transporter BioY [Lachnospiraceae bacterium]|nr:biotin transporter BioY [Lachnospiraceae bacterium]MCI8826457.1 biotin transporter BioY [Lachnospiraceae bacterium]MDE7308750.1 biotin transporter BioY [Lachnospiraceae bacterium]
MSEKVNVIPKSKISVETIGIIGIFTAFISIISAIPIGIELFGVPATLQTFAMAFIGFVLCQKLGTASCCIYILLGFIGIPVYNKFMAGPSVLFGPTGGFIIGFLLLAFFSGLGMKLTQKFHSAALKAVVAIAASLIGLILCHLIGIIQFSIVSDTTFIKSMVLVSLPYLPKDIVSAALAYFIAVAVRKALSKARLLPAA